MKKLNFFYSIKLLKNSKLTLFRNLNCQNTKWKYFTKIILKTINLVNK